MESRIAVVDDSPQSLISMAIQNNVDIEKLEKLLALKERYDATQAKKKFLLSLSNFQKDVPEIKKKKLVNYSNRSGGNTNYKYAELGEIDETIKGAMASNGLSKRWEIAEEGENLICTCIISHVDGHSERTTLSSVKDTSGNKNEIQSRASAISYLQRYTLIGALGLTTASEDNDGDGTPPPRQPAAASNNNAELPWLNFTDKSGAKTADGLLIEKDIASGAVTIDQLKTQYRISKTTLEVLQNIKVGQPAGQSTTAAVPISKPDPAAPPITDDDKAYRTVTNDAEFIYQLIDKATDPKLLKIFHAVNLKFFKTNPEAEKKLIEKGQKLNPGKAVNGHNNGQPAGQSTTSTN